MSFHKQRIVLKPQKVYYCDACCRLITGEHIYAVGKYLGEFGYARYHLKCMAEMQRMCADCEYRGDCMGSVNECFQIKKQEEERKAEANTSGIVSDDSKQQIQSDKNPAWDIN